MLVINKVFGLNRVLTANEFGGVKSDDKSIQKLVEPKTRKLFTSRKLLKSEINYLSQKNCLNPKICLNQEKSCEKVGIYFILVLKRLNKAF